MKVLLVNKFLYPRGGDAVCTFDTGRLLAHNGHDVSYWGMAHPSNPPLRHNDLFADYLDLSRPSGFYQRLRTARTILYSRKAMFKIDEFIQRERPDIVHLNNFAHQISPSILRVLHRHKIPAVMTLHDYKLVCASYLLLAHGSLCDACANGRYHKCLQKRCVKGSLSKSLLNTLEMYLHHMGLHIYDIIRLFISPSHFLKEKIHEMGFHREIAVLPHFVDLDDYEPFFGSDEESLVFFGRLSSEKGLMTLLKATEEMSVQLKIIGEGPLRTTLENEIAKKKIRNVVFLGHRTGRALYGEVRKAMCVVVPSEWYENNPRTILEAFALGKPVIGSRIGGIPELIRNGETGWTFCTGDAYDLRRKILYCLAHRNELRKVGERAHRVVLEKHSPHVHYEQLMSIYQKAMGI